MPTTLRQLALLLLIASCSPLPAGAQGKCTAVSPDCVVVGEWDLSVALGAGVRTNPIAGRSDIPLIVVPQLSYYGKRFFLDNLEPGFTLHEGVANTFNVVAAPGYDRVFFSRGDPQNVLVSGPLGSTGGGAVAPGEEGSPGDDGSREEFPHHRRRTTYLAGPEWLFSYGGFAGQLSALYEFTGRHKGYEIRGALSAPLIQTEHSLIANAGFTWKSAETVRYYYGVKGLYRPAAALNPFVKLGYSRVLSERWTLSAFVHYEYFSGEIADSPIVSDPAVVTAFVGFNFKVF
ncbi:outer membrane MltA-interaction protein MipA [Steroidobacter agaridevorans]|uniref:Outer membrane MltA-interaction protein MipA n=1 Tax=Steroidobacter agaridevorans TaxID=2695856 RepID=A0A829YB10_9GAMM|nr:MipA/OmpV family protein [Steroidobacter agaridevorans]GFE80295.1 outer membrane MltA-interaction protein MipA [Steroidobacter agaridevorans]GFE87348.1 outer membrane MltA-interaction protein MipA [Steroidobacter agaridevorans]